MGWSRGSYLTPEVWKSTRAMGTLPGAWCRRHRRALHQIMDPVRLDKLLSVNTGEWSSVAHELDVESKSGIGQLLFGEHLHACATERADKKATEDATEYVTGKTKIDRASLEAAIKATVAAIAAFPGSCDIPERRKVPRDS